MGWTNSTDVLAAHLRAYKDELWRAGVLRWKLHSDQQAVYDAILACEDDQFILEIARRWGKTRLLVGIACETAIRNPGCRIVYGAPTLKHLQEFILPTFDEVTRDAPADCKPSFHQQSGHWNFPNGSWVHLFGADDKRKAGRGRGSESALNIFDEAGFTPVLDYVLTDVFRATTMHRGGRMLLGSTPADEPDHPFTRIAEIAESNGGYARRTIYDNPLLSAERIQRFIEQGAREQGLSVEEYKKTDTFRREYLAERVVNRLLVAVPEWADARNALIQRVPRPEFFDAYVAMDPGGHDPTALVFAYWHFEKAALVVEGEVLLRDNENSIQLAAAAKAKESTLWGTDSFDGTLRAAFEDSSEVSQHMPQWMSEILGKEAKPQPYARWMDTNEILARDLYTLHKMAFLPTQKDHKEASVGELRVAIREGRLLVSPECTHLDRHLRTTMWKDAKRKEFARKAGEHGDLVDALVYCLRNINRQRNPYPRGWVAPANPHRASAAAAESRQLAALPPLRLARRR